MNRLLVVSNYPTSSNIKDGMLQRIKTVDDEFSEWQREYVLLSYTSNRKPKTETYEDGRVTVYRLNVFIHYFIIRRLLNKNVNVYVHSLLNLIYLFFFNLKKCRVTVDAHGSVPEEYDFNNKTVMSKILSFFEKRLFKRVNNLIFVSEEMKDYYVEKYPYLSNRNLIVKPIFSPNAFVDSNENDQKKMRESLQINNDDTVFIYSGNIQAWQNVDQVIDNMIEIAKDSYFFIFLTGEKDGMQKIIDQKIGTRKIRYIIDSVQPNELYKYYSISHYGYLLRDEHILNRVASPTKLIEYLYYGIVPIMKYERVGDAFRMGFDYISIKDNMFELPPRKSAHNKEIALNIASKSNECSLISLYQS